MSASTGRGHALVERGSADVMNSRYSSGRSTHRIKAKNPNTPAVKRETEEDWG